MLLLSMIHCPTDAFSLAVTGLQCLNLAAFANEMQAPTGYSKFASGKATMPSKTGMLLIYMPATITAAVSLATGDRGNGRELIITTMLLVHFAKRVGEVLCVHAYSGFTSGPLAGFIGTFYALITLLIATSQAAVPASVYADGDTIMALAITLFLVGEAGNGYHHWLLSTMRRGDTAMPTVPPTPSSRAAGQLHRVPSAHQPMSSGGSYVIPKGALFDYVTMPHYLFELCAWLGIALCAQQINAVLAFAGMASYLSGRAVATTQWYKTKFGDDYPKDRKHLVPFLF